MTTLPFALRLEPRLEKPPRSLRIALPVISVGLALLISSVVLVAAGRGPLSAYETMFKAAFTSPGALSATLVSATPLVLTGLAAAVAFRMKIWNVGGEGQFYLGAVAAAGAGIALGSHGLALALPAMLVAGILGGALWAAVPGVLRAYLNTNEILTSLMLNYVGGLLVYFLIVDSHSYWRDLSSPAGQVYPQGKAIDPAAFWPGFVGSDVIVPLGFLIGLLLAFGVFVLLRSTRLGFQMRVVAESPEVGQYAGIRTKRSVVLVMLISGGLAGVAGASYIGDFSHLLEPTGLQQGAYGYAGIVAAALARYHPLGVVASALFLGALTNAGFRLQGPDFPAGLIGAMQGIILFCVLGTELFTRYRLRPRRPTRATGQPTPHTALPAKPRTADPKNVLLANEPVGGSDMKSVRDRGDQE